MITQADIPQSRWPTPTMWGLTPVQLHDRFWATRGVAVIRQGEDVEITKDAELYLLTDPRSLTIFRLRPLIEPLSWLNPDVLWIRLHVDQERGYREHAISDDHGHFIRFERDYGGADPRLARVVLTPSADVAQMWRDAPDAKTGWRQLRKSVPHSRSITRSVDGYMYSSNHTTEIMTFMQQLVQWWRFPQSSIDRISPLTDQVWVDCDANINKQSQFIGSAWVGAGRELTDEDVVVGPALLWDNTEKKPDAPQFRWEELDPNNTLVRKPRRYALKSKSNRYAKRIFDMVVSLLVLILISPLLPLVMLAIYIEDGRPFFFGHRRETLGAHEFSCWKFRSMRKDADEIKAKLAIENQVDGPQFYIENDPRITRIGKFIRKVHIDELPQLINVLAGHMSLVGPRPSPRKENQFCPAWREARLSVRPGITGLWQVCRTREPGKDFQEWIKYDIEYVERASFWLDLWIIGKTVINILTRK